MKRSQINREGDKGRQRVSAAARAAVERHTHRIIMNVFGKRFELTHYVQIRELRKRPAEVIEMTRRPTNGGKEGPRA